MNIIESSRNDFDKRDIYALTRAQSVSLKDVESGYEIKPVDWLKYGDTNSRGTEVEILAIRDDGGVVYSTNSKTFKSEFDYIAALMADDDYSVRVVKAMSKNNREFITCELV